MKTCKNCGTTNAVENIKCTGCNMPGNFEFHGEISEAAGVPEEKKVACSNCGNYHPGEGANCVHCRFPLGQMNRKPIANKNIRLFRKVG